MFEGSSLLRSFEPQFERGPRSSCQHPGAGLDRQCPFAVADAFDRHPELGQQGDVQVGQLRPVVPNVTPPVIWPAPPLRPEYSIFGAHADQELYSLLE